MVSGASRTRWGSGCWWPCTRCAVLLRDHSVIAAGVDPGTGWHHDAHGDLSVVADADRANCLRACRGWCVEIPVSCMARLAWRREAQQCEPHELFGGPHPRHRRRVVDPAHRSQHHARATALRGHSGDLGIARNILSDRLNTLVAAGVLERVKYQDHPERFEYHPTDKGRDLYPVIAALRTWGDRWAAPDRAGRVGI